MIILKYDLTMITRQNEFSHFKRNCLTCIFHANFRHFSPERVRPFMNHARRTCFFGEGHLPNVRHRKENNIYQRFISSAQSFTDDATALSYLHDTIAFYTCYSSF